jgi:hypothetical protein
MLQLRRGLSFRLAHVVNSRREGKGGIVLSTKHNKSTQPWPKPGLFLWAPIGGRLPCMNTLYPKKPKPLHTYEEKPRRCLKCRESFTSSWPGERVCPRCKTSKIWIEGAAPNHEYQ